MLRWPRADRPGATALAAVAALLLLMRPGLAQDDSGDGPKSLLPGVFAAPPPPPVEEPPPVSATPTASPTPTPGETPPAKPLAGTLPPRVASGDPNRLGGVVPPQGYRPDIWRGARADTVLPLIDALPSQLSTRAGYQTLRRLMLTRAAAPAGVSAPDFAAARLRRLLIAGDVQAAKQLASAVPLTSYSRLLYAWAAQTHLAAMDMMAVCPLVPGGQTLSRDSLWLLMSAVCQAIQGDEQGAALELDRAREKRIINPLDLQITDRLIVGIGSNARGGSATLSRQDRLTSYRLAAALVAGTPLPTGLIDAQPPAIKAWLARAPLAAGPLQRMGVESAAVLGILSRGDLQSATAAMSAGLDQAALAKTPAGLARQALAARRLTERIDALNRLWLKEATPAQMRYRALLGAPAAALLQPSASLAPRAGALVRILALSGQPTAVVAWWPHVLQAARTNDGAGATLLALWPQALVLGKRGTVPRSAELATTWFDFHADATSAVQERRAALFSAVLDGVGLSFSANQQDDLPRSMRTPTAAPVAARAEARAAAMAGRRGEAALRALNLLGTDPLLLDPNDARAALTALRLAGFSGEARLIGAELLVLNGV